MDRRAFLAVLFAPFLKRLAPYLPARKVVFHKARPIELNPAYLEWYFSQAPRFHFGFTGFKNVAGDVDRAGGFLVGSNLMIPSCSQIWWLKGEKSL